MFGGISTLKNRISCGDTIFEKSGMMSTELKFAFSDDRIES